LKLLFLKKEKEKVQSRGWKEGRGSICFRKSTPSRGGIREDRTRKALLERGERGRGGLPFLKEGVRTERRGPRPGGQPSRGT